jgi:hypothetical protein
VVSKNKFEGKKGRKKINMVVWVWHSHILQSSYFFELVRCYDGETALSIIAPYFLSSGLVFGILT